MKLTTLIQAVIIALVVFAALEAFDVITVSAPLLVTLGVTALLLAIVNLLILRQDEDTPS